MARKPAVNGSDARARTTDRDWRVDHGRVTGGGQRPRRLFALLLSLASVGLFLASWPATALAAITFNLARSTAVRNAGCLLGASGHVTVTTFGKAELMEITVTGLPPNTEFDVFVIQVPNAPFGLSWYQGDIETDASGTGQATFIGRFSIETFIVAPGVAPAPVVHNQPPFPDAATNPATAPVHTYHVGVWFNSPADAAAAGCPNTVTPFNGDHTAGIQALSTRKFADDQGPLRQLTP